jgi:hypothetical protein
MLIVLWYSDGILLTGYHIQGNAINGQYYASLINRLRAVILEKQCDQVSRCVVPLHDDVSVHKSNTANAVIHQVDFVELNHPAYSRDIAPAD